MDQDTAGLALGEQARQVLADSQLIDYHGAEKGEKAQTRVENLKELVSACADFEPKTQRKTLGQFFGSSITGRG